MKAALAIVLLLFALAPAGAAGCKRNPQVGMTVTEVQAACGQPYGKRRLTTANGIVDVHTYYFRNSSSGMRNDLYFSNGTLAAIQEGL